MPSNGWNRTSDLKLNALLTLATAAGIVDQVVIDAPIVGAAVVVAADAVVVFAAVLFCSFQLSAFFLEIDFFPVVIENASCSRPRSILHSFFAVSYTSVSVKSRHYICRSCLEPTIEASGCT